jgi:hypothetical protein
MVDDGKQFDCATFRAFYEQLGTKLCFTSVYHPQSNRAIERANGFIFIGIKMSITEQPMGKWVDELPKVIWSHNTIASRTTMFSPFKLLYGEEAMTPEEIKFRSWRTEENPHEDLVATVDVIETVKLRAAANLNKYQDETQMWKNKKVKPREIKEGHLILRRVLKGNMKGKMKNKWEGPFLVTEISRPEACRLRTLEVLMTHTCGTRTCCRSILYKENVRATEG